MPPVGFEPTISAGERPQAPYIYIYDISNLRVKGLILHYKKAARNNFLGVIHPTVERYLLSRRKLLEFWPLQNLKLNVQVYLGN